MGSYTNIEISTSTDLIHVCKVTKKVMEKLENSAMQMFDLLSFETKGESFNKSDIRLGTAISTRVVKETTSNVENVTQTTNFSCSMLCVFVE